VSQEVLGAQRPQPALALLGVVAVAPQAAVAAPAHVAPDLPCGVAVVQARGHHRLAAQRARLAKGQAQRG
jgi:hypothetical protein